MRGSSHRQSGRPGRGTPPTARCGSPTSTSSSSAGSRSAPGRAAAHSPGLLRPDHAPRHDPAWRRHRHRPCVPVRADPLPRWSLGGQLRHLPRPLPALRGQLEVHRARLRGHVPRRHSADRLSASRTGGRPLTRQPGTSLRRKEDGGNGITTSPGTWDLDPVPSLPRTSGVTRARFARRCGHTLATPENLG